MALVMQEALKALHRACALLYTVWRQGLKITDREDHQELRRALPSLPTSLHRGIDMLVNIHALFVLAESFLKIEKFYVYHILYIQL